MLYPKILKYKLGSHNLTHSYIATELNTFQTNPTIINRFKYTFTILTTSDTVFYLRIISVSYVSSTIL